MKRKTAICVSLLILISVAGFSRNHEGEGSASTLTVERIFASNEFRAERFGPVLWLKDSSGYLTLEKSESQPGRNDLIRYRIEGNKEVMVSASKLTPSGKSTPLRMDGFYLSPDGNYLLVLTNTRRVFHKTYGDYWIFDIENRNLWKLGQGFEPGSLTLATFSPDGRKIGYVQDGTHSYQLSPDSGWAFHTYSRFETPPVTSLIRLPDHQNMRTLVQNSRLRENVESLERYPVEFFRIDIGDGVLLDAWSMKPPDFDPQKKYPVLFYVYGEPWGSTVRDSWGGNRYLWHLMLTQQDYIVMSVDNRGTRMPRGRAWRKIIYRQVGMLASSDQAAAVRAIIASRDYVDPDRIGVWGWSGGGAMTLNAMFRYPDLYRTGMSVAPVTNQRLYNSIYQERYMGLPEDNVEGYEKGSPVTFAHQLKGNLLLVHGTGDDNVHYQNTEMLINELIKHNKSFTMMSYPNRSHGIREGKNTSLHLFELLTQYLKKNLPPGPLSF